MAGRRERVVGADRVLADLERALEQRLGRIVALLPDVDAAQAFERHGDRRAFLAVHLLAQAQGLRVVALGVGKVAGALADQRQRIGLDAHLLVLGPELADHQRQGALGVLQRLVEGTGLVEISGGVAQVLQFARRLLCAAGANASSKSDCKRAQREADVTHD